MNKWRYTIVSGREARIGEEYIFSVFIEGYLNGTKEITAAFFKNSYESITGKCEVAERKFEVNYGETTFLRLKIPLGVIEGLYYFGVRIHSLEPQNMVEVDLKRKVQSIFIQTDKGIYKPGQEVKFRTITVDPDLKPYKDDISITIYDQSQNKIKRLTSMKNDYGVITDSLKLSDQTPLGTWKIEAKTKLHTETETFEVSEYVLPKFEVKLDCPAILFLNNDKPHAQKPLLISATAFYTYGQPVNGKARIQIELEYIEGIGKMSVQANVTHIDLVKGKADKTLDYQNLMQLHPHICLHCTKQITLKVDVKVLETVTGEERTASRNVVLKPDRLKIEFLPNTQKNFKPGLRYHAFLRITKIDSSAVPVSELKNSIGKFKYITLQLKKKHCQKKRFLPVDENGFIFFNVHIPLDYDHFSIKMHAVFYDDVIGKEVTAEMEVEKFETEHLGGIQISLFNSPLVIKPNVKICFKVETVEERKRVTLQIMAKGSVVEYIEEEKEKATKEHYFELCIHESLALQLAPEAVCVAWYVSLRGELIADSMTINVQDYMRNKVSLSFNKKETKPGDKEVILTVKTPDSSYVGLIGVDQSVLLLNQGNDLTTQKLEKELDSYRSVTDDCDRRMSHHPHMHHWSNEKNTHKIFKKSGLQMLTTFLCHKVKPVIIEPTYHYVKKAVKKTVKKVVKKPIYEACYMTFNSHGNRNQNSLCDVVEFDEIIEYEYEKVADPVPEPKKVIVEVPKPVVKVRKSFPETFIWSDFITDEKGNFQLTVSIPDTITSWSTTAFSLNSHMGLALTQHPAKITVIKNFFVSLKLPYSVIKGEQFQLQVTVFNYHDQDLKTQVNLTYSTSFKVIDCDRSQVNQQDAIKSVMVDKNNATAVTFWLQATSLGYVTLQVSAISDEAADAMTTKILVKPEGKPESYSTSFLMQLSTGKDFHKEINIEVPSKEQLVEGSIRTQVTLIGDVMGTSMNGLEDLLHMPSGCGEQNLVYLAPDVYLLKYLSLTNQLTPAFKKKALIFINAGYQRQLTYQRTDGSFSAFGNSDRAGSVWLSSFTIKSLHQAKDFIPVDNKYLAKTINWIISYQDSSGKFAEHPNVRVCHSNIQGGAASGHALTAYTLIALIENQDNAYVGAHKLKESISKAKSYLETNFKQKLSNAYNLAIMSYALFKSKSTHLNTFITELNKLAIKKDDMTYWKNVKDTSSDAWTCTYTRATSYSIELASYMLALYSQQGNLTEAFPIARWLLTQRNGFGGFSSTQDTVLALEALASFSSLLGTSNKKDGIRLSVTHNNETLSFDPIYKDNALILQSYHLPAESEKLLFKGTGSGVAVVQLNVNYNVNVAHNNNFLSLTLSSQQKVKDVVLDIKTSWSGIDVSGMVMVEVSLLTGHTLVKEEQTTKMLGHYFKKIDKSEDKVFFYLCELTKSVLHMCVFMTETVKVSNVKPAYVKVYRYYDTQHMATSFYSQPDTTINPFYRLL